MANGNETTVRPTYIGPYIATAVQMPLLVLHTSVTVFTATKLYKLAADYSSPFYKLFLLQRAANYMCYFTNFINQFTDDFLGVNPTNALAMKIIIVLPLDFAAYFQLAVTSSIAANRFTAIVLPFDHQRIWKGCMYWIALIFSVLVPVLLMISRVVVWQINYRTAATDPLAAWMLAGSIRAQTMSLANILSAIIHALLELSALLVFNKMDVSKRHRNAHNFRLLLFALAELPLQLMKAAYYLLIRIEVYDAIFNGNRALADILDDVMVVIVALQALLPPLLLLLVSSFMRQDFLVFYRLRTPQQVARVTVSTNRFSV